MDPPQNPRPRQLTIYDDTPDEGHRIKVWLSLNPGHEIARLTGRQQVALVRSTYRLTEVEFTESAGSYGTILTGRQPRTNRKLAIKLIQCRYNHPNYVNYVHVRRVVREITILGQLRGHQNIVELFAASFSRSRHALLQTEFLGQTLVKIVELHSLQEGNVIRLARQMITALSYLQERNIVHHDIKPDNIMMVEFVDPRLDPFEINQRLSDANFKFIDFGHAKIYRVANPIERVYRYGTTFYKSPEKLSGLLFPQYSAKLTDLYSLGVCLLQAYFGNDAIKDYIDWNDVMNPNEPDVPNWLAVAQGMFTIRPGHSIENVILGLLNAEAQRYSVENAENELQHLRE